MTSLKKVLGRRARLMALGGAAIALAVGCESPVEGPETADDPRFALADSEPFPPAVGMDYQLLELGKRTEGGFGGMYIDETGQLVARIRDAAKHEIAQDQLSAELRRAVRVEPATFTFDQLHRWHVAATDVHTIEGVVYSDADERANRVVFGVESSAVVDEVRRLLDKVGVPQEAVGFRVDVAPLIRELAPHHVPVTSKFRPNVPGGVQIENGATSPCTLGANVNHYVHGRTFFTASHCGNRTSTDSQPYYQPADATGQRVGMEVMDPTPSSPTILDVYGNSYPCPAGYGCRWSDVSLVAYDDSIGSEHGKVAHPTALGSKHIDHTTPRFHLGSGVFCWMGLSGCNFSGQTVWKVGAVTGWTQGTINATCVSTNWSAGFN